MQENKDKLRELFDRKIRLNYVIMLIIGIAFTVVAAASYYFYKLTLFSALVGLIVFAIAQGYLREAVAITRYQQLVKGLRQIYDKLEELELRHK